MSGNQISPHFSEKEFACKCCGEVKVDIQLVERLEQLREYLGVRPIIITSGYRCPKHNKEVGGAPNSYHLLGKAADIRVRGLDGPTLARKAKLFFGGIGIAEDWAHVDIRQRKTMWAYGEGRKHEKVAWGS